MSNIVYDTLLKYAPLDRKKTLGGWTSFNGSCCIHNGETRPDTRKRAGVRLTPEGYSVYNCFNCKFKATWVPGRSLSGNMKSLMQWMGVSQEDVKKLDFKIWQLRENVKAEVPIQRDWVKLDFPEKALPKGAKPLAYWLEQNCQDKDFLAVLTYIAGRGDDLLTSFEYYWTPDREHSMNRRLIIPFMWQGKNIGYTARAIFPTRNRYYTDVPPGYFFNSEIALTDWQYLLINEGPLDAIASNGLGMLGDKISREQIQWINQTGKTPIVVPDREKQGGNLVDIALHEGWYVTFPRWDKEIKDAAKASEVYGKLFTVWSLIDARTNNRLQISVERQRLR